jgi:hypothetical protein
MATLDRSTRFLRFFRSETERRWRASTRPHGTSGLAAPLPRWLRDATWSPPLAERAIAALEARWGIAYSQDVRRFLGIVNAQRRRRSFISEDEDGTRRVSKLYVIYDQLRDVETIATARERLSERIDARIARGDVWFDAWGVRPAAAAARRRRAAAAFAEAPQLIPMALHMFVVSGADLRTTPVFGVHPYDLQLWCKAATWEAYLVDEFADFLGSGIKRFAPTIARASRREPRIPFWSAFAAWCEAEQRRENELPLAEPGARAVGL